MRNSYYDEFPWFVRAENEKQHLRRSGQTSGWSEKEIDYAFSGDTDKTKLELKGFTQDALEYFVVKYGKDYECLYFNVATQIKDFSPLADLPNLKSVSINWCRSNKLWDMSKNEKLINLWISSAKKITYELNGISGCKSLENLMICGDMDSPYPIRSFSCLSELPHLRRIDLMNIKSEDHDISFLFTLPQLKEFHFDAGMLTTEEIAFICARFPQLKGRSLRAFTTEFTLNDVRICGYRKPGLDLPEQQKRFDKYVAEFNALVEKYKNI